MTVRASMIALQSALGELDVALESLRARAVDQGDADLQIASAIAERAVAMRGSLAGARAVEPVDVQRRILGVARELEELLSYEAVRDVHAAGRSGGAGWRDWAIEVADALESCRVALHDAEDRLLACWQELSETQHPLTPGGEQLV